MSGREKVRVGIVVGVNRWESAGSVEERSKMCVAPESEIRGCATVVRRVGLEKMAFVYRVGLCTNWERSKLAEGEGELC